LSFISPYHPFQYILCAPHLLDNSGVCLNKLANVVYSKVLFVVLHPNKFCCYWQLQARLHLGMVAVHWISSWV